MHRRAHIFFANRLALLSSIFLITLTLGSFTAELWSNDRPLAMKYQGHYYFPWLTQIAPERLGLTDGLEVDYHALKLVRPDWAIWPLNRWGPFAINKNINELPSAPSAENWFGTDDRGRDVFARLLYGFRYSLVFALLVWAGSSLLALVYGGACGFLGGWVDLIGQRISEILLTVPQLMLLLFAISIFEPSLPMLVLVSCGFGWIGLSFFVRGEVLRVRALPFVEAAVALGASRAHVFTRYVLPNCLLSLVTLAPMVIIGNITALAGLDYLGLGLPPPTPSWGELMQQAQTYLTWAIWLAFYPALLLFLVLLSLTFFAEGLRQALDPLAKAPVRDRKVQNSKWRLRLPAAAVVAAVLVCTFSALAAADEVSQGSIRTDRPGVGLTGVNAPVPDWSRDNHLGYQNLNSEATGGAAVRTNRLSLRHEHAYRRVPYFGLNVDLTRAQDHVQRVDGQRAVVYVGLKPFRRGTLTLTLGTHRLVDADANRGSEPPTALYAAEYSDEAPERWEYTLLTADDYLYADWASPAAGVQALRGTKYFARGEIKVWERLHLRSSGQIVHLNDRNYARETDQGFMVETWRGRLSSMFGAGAWWLAYQNATDRYWTPKRFFKYELRSEHSLQLAKALRASLNLNLGRGADVHQTYDWNGFLEARLNWKWANQSELNVGWTQMKSWNPFGTWERNDVSVSVVSPL